MLGEDAVLEGRVEGDDGAGVESDLAPIRGVKVRTGEVWG